MQVGSPPACSTANLGAVVGDVVDGVPRPPGPFVCPPPVVLMVLVAGAHRRPIRRPSPQSRSALGVVHRRCFFRTPVNLYGAVDGLLRTRTLAWAVAIEKPGWRRGPRRLVGAGRVGRGAGWSPSTRSAIVLLRRARGRMVVARQRAQRARRVFARRRRSRLVLAAGWYQCGAQRSGRAVAGARRRTTRARSCGDPRAGGYTASEPPGGGASAPRSSAYRGHLATSPFRSRSSGSLAAVMARERLGRLERRRSTRSSR